MEVRYKLTVKGQKKAKKRSLFRWLRPDEEATLEVLKGRQTFGVTRGKLAKMTGYSRRETSLALRRLRDEGMIESEIGNLPTEKPQLLQTRRSPIRRSKAPRITPKTPRLRR